MTNPIAEELARDGIAAYRAGERERAHTLLLQALELDPRLEMAWLWLVMLAPTPGEQRYCLERALELNPDRPMIRERLEKLGDVAPVPPRPLVAGESGSDSLPYRDEAHEPDDTSIPLMAAEVMMPTTELPAAESPRRAAMPNANRRRLVAGLPWWMIAIPLVVLVGVVGIITGMVVAGGSNSIVSLIMPPTATPIPTPAPVSCGVRAAGFIEQAGSLLDAAELAEGGQEAAPENRARLEQLQAQLSALESPACAAPARRTLLKMLATSIDAFSSVEQGDLETAQLQFGLVALSEAEYRSKVQALRASAALPTGSVAFTLTATQIRSAYEARQFIFETEENDQGRVSIRGSIGDGPQSIRIIGDPPQEVTFFTSVADGMVPTDLDQYLVLMMPDWSEGPNWVRTYLNERGYTSVVVGRRMVTMFVFRPEAAPGSVVAVLIEPMGE